LLPERVFAPHLGIFPWAGPFHLPITLSLGDVADYGLPTVLYVDVLDSYLLLSFRSMFVQCFDQ
jgi:hypothetical protein